MKTSDSIGLLGHLKVTLEYPEKTVLHFEEDNVITLPAKQRVLSAVYSSSITADPITRLYVGTGGCIDLAGLYPKPVNQTLTSLYTSYTYINVSYTVDPSVPAVTYLADVDQSTANGQYINEAAMFTSLGNMFNIKTFPSIPKTAEFAIHFQWTVKIP